MRVLHFGGTGNLGSRVIPALLAHGHDVIVCVRAPRKLREMMPGQITEKIIIVQGDARDTANTASLLRQHHCDAVINTAGNFDVTWKEQTLPKIVQSISSAAVAVGEERGKPLRAWFIGGIGSLQYPNTGHQIQDCFPASAMTHLRLPEMTMKSIATSKLEWTLLCVAWMYPESAKIMPLESPRHHTLTVAVSTPPLWQDHWIRSVPFVGICLNLFLALKSYTAYYEEVADLIAEGVGKPRFVGELVGYKSSQDKRVA